MSTFNSLVFSPDFLRERDITSNQNRAYYRKRLGILVLLIVHLENEITISFMKCLLKIQ
jgi:hypothetical protein